MRFDDIQRAKILRIANVMIDVAGKFRFLKSRFAARATAFKRRCIEKKAKIRFASIIFRKNFFGSRQNALTRRKIFRKNLYRFFGIIIANVIVKPKARTDAIAVRANVAKNSDGLSFFQQFV